LPTSGDDAEGLVDCLPLISTENSVNYRLMCIFCAVDVNITREVNQLLFEKQPDLWKNLQIFW